MPEMPNVAPGEIIASDHINQLRDRTVQRYASEADRTAENPTPTHGDLSYVTALSEMSIWNGARWVVYATYEGTVPEDAVTLAPLAPWSGTLTLIKQGGLCVAQVNTTRTAVTLNNLTLFNNIPTELQPQSASVRFQMAALTSVDPVGIVIPMVTCLITVNTGSLIVQSRMEGTVSLVGSFTYRVSP